MALRPSSAEDSEVSKTEQCSAEERQASARAEVQVLLAEEHLFGAMLRSMPTSRPTAPVRAAQTRARFWSARAWRSWSLRCGLGAGELEGLLGGGVDDGAHRRPRGQKAAAKARPRAPVTRSFSSNPTSLMATVWTPSLELTVPRVTRAVQRDAPSDRGRVGSGVARRVGSDGIACLGRRRTEVPVVERPRAPELSQIHSRRFAKRHAPILCTAQSAHSRAALF